MSSAPNRTTILIVTWNGDDLLADCLDSIAATYTPPPQTIVVDNASLASTRELTARYANVRYLASPENLGFAGGNNLGWELVETEYAVLLNNDTRLTGDSIAPLVRYMDEHPTCAAAQGTLVFASDPDKTDGTGMWWSPVGILAGEGELKPLAESPQAPREVFSVGGAFFIVRKSAVARAGGLFRGHFKSYYEEVDLCHRLWRTGWECAYVPTPPVLHRRSATAVRFGWERILVQYYRNVWFSTLACFGWRGLLRFVPSLAALCLAQSLVGALRGNMRPLKAHARNAVRLWRERGAILSERRSLQRAAVRGDVEILRIAVRRQPWSYYWALFRRG